MTPRFVKQRSLQSFQEVDLSNPGKYSQLDAKTQFLCEQLKRLEKNLSLLRHPYVLPEEKIRVDFLAKSQTGEIVFAWYIKKLDAESFLKLFSHFEILKRKLKQVSGTVQELKESAYKIPKFWILTQVLSPQLELLISNLQGISFEVFRLKIINRGENASVLLQKFVKTPIKSLEEREAESKNLNLFSSLLDPQKINNLPKIIAVKKENSFKRPHISAEEIRDFLETDAPDLQKDYRGEEILNPFLSFENF